MNAASFDRAALNRMYKYCFALTNDEDAAYDLLQDGLERYLRASRDIVDNPSAFLRRIIRNRFIDGLRDRGARILGDGGETDPNCLSIGFSSLETLAIAEQDLDRIWSRLDPLERELLSLWALEGYTAREVSEQLHTPLGTVLARIHRLRCKIVRHSKADDGNPSAGGGAL